MKKALLTLATAAALTTTMANAQVQFGVIAGPSFSRYLDHTETNAIAGIDYTPGFYAGCFMDINIKNSFFISPNVQLNLKRAQIKGDDEETKDFKNRFRTTWIDVPVYCTYKIWFGGNDAGIRLDAGPLFEVGLGGSWIEEVDDKEVKKEDVFDDFEWRHFNFGLSYGGGFFIRRVTIGAHYDWGFLNLNKQTGHNLRENFNTLKVMLAYTF